jgi:hypothetical protein
MAVVSSAKSISFDMEFIFRGRSFIYSMNDKGPRIEHGVSVLVLQCTILSTADLILCDICK